MIEASTDAMSLSSHGGLLVLRQEEEHLALASQLSSCIHDSRTPYLVRHRLTEILMTRIFQICLGYEDVNDCNRMRRDPMMQLAVDTGALPTAVRLPAISSSIAMTPTLTPTAASS